MLTAESSARRAVFGHSINICWLAERRVQEAMLATGQRTQWLLVVIVASALPHSLMGWLKCSHFTAWRGGCWIRCAVWPARAGLGSETGGWRRSPQRHQGLCSCPSEEGTQRWLVGGRTPPPSGQGPWSLHPPGFRFRLPGLPSVSFAFLSPPVADSVPPPLDPYL